MFQPAGDTIFSQRFNAASLTRDAPSKKKTKPDLKKVFLFMHFLLQIKIQMVSQYPDKKLRTNFWKHTEVAPTSHRLNKNWVGYFLSVETENFVCLFRLMWLVYLRLDNKGQRKEELCPIQNDHLQHKLPDTVQMGSQENFPQPHAQPSDLCRSGKQPTKFFLIHRR